LNRRRPCCTTVDLFRIRRQLACQRATVNLSNPTSDPFTSRPIPHTRPIPCSSTRSELCLRLQSTAQRSFTLLVRLAPLSHLKEGRYPLTATLPLPAPPSLFSSPPSVDSSVCGKQSLLYADPAGVAQHRTPATDCQSIITTDALFHSLFAPSSFVRFASHFLRSPFVRASFLLFSFTASKTSPASCTTDNLVRATHADKPHSISCNRLYAFSSSPSGNSHLLNTVTDQTTQPPQTWVVV